MIAFVKEAEALQEKGQLERLKNEEGELKVEGVTREKRRSRGGGGGDGQEGGGGNCCDQNHNQFFYQGVYHSMETRN